MDFVEYRNFKEMEKYAPYIDYFMISGEKSILPIFEAFSEKYKGLFNVSLADKGSVTYHNGEKYFVQANKVKEVIDTTGCGDSYHAGFVCSHLINGNIYEAMRVGTYFGCPSGKIGLLSSMFTDPEYRRRGIAKELLSRVIDDAREYGCGTIQITASDMGVKLYTDFGFVHNGNFMQYKL